ncbi:MAG: treY [Marmoricola sp.]|nr:treY [Marmoricola sp.]
MSAPPGPGRAPSSTYRLQISADFDLKAATAVLPYLHDLGVGWVYLSPVLQAAPGSNHGYDVVDPTRIDPERGGPEAFEALSHAAHELGMGVLVDIVPNHVGVAVPADNPWWWDLLRGGQQSEFATYFDVDWDVADGRIRLPVVGEEDLDPGTGAIAALGIDDGVLTYYEHRFPLADGTAPADPGTADLQEVHARQHYELVSWRDADSRLNYRRFFAVNTLAGVRVEDPVVFDAAHSEIRRWFEDGLVDGLRVDHPDGLRDPAGYLDRLAGLTGGAYVLVEKILEPGEVLPGGWATAGTTGYDVLAMIDRVLTDPAGEVPLTELEEDLRGSVTRWPELIHATKLSVARGILRSEVLRLVREVSAELAPGTSTPDEIEEALAELLACFPVYRSYLPQGREHLDQAAEAALLSRPDLGTTLSSVVEVLADPSRPAAQRFQQTSGMVMAKGVEDQAFYRWSRLTSLDEVGADPAQFALDPDDFHQALAERNGRSPDAMTSLSTHDTKRSEDVRARLAVLAEVPDRWRAFLRDVLEAVPTPDPGFSNLLWQAIVGAWPASRERLHAYAEKAMREANERTTWTDPAADFERRVHAVVDAAFDVGTLRSALDDLLTEVVDPGWSNALSAKLLCLMVPGVPDVYQGSERWEQSLVDPDNRRPVDFAENQRLLGSLEHCPTLTGGIDDPGTAKLWLTRTILRLRRDRPELFTRYRPVEATGPAAAHAFAFDRGGVIAVVTRLPVGLERGGGWRGTRLDLPEGTWHNLLDGRATTGDLGDLLRDLPVAVLVQEET